MQKRICPNCLTRWYSSDSSQIWKCETCGHEIPAPKNELVIEQSKNKGGNLIMKKLIVQVEKLTEEELKNSMIKFPLFNSTHEGYAVIKEEVEEAAEELENVNFSLSSIWRNVKINDKETAIKHAGHLKDFAIKLAAEAIQVAAMAQKFTDSFKEVEKIE